MADRRSGPAPEEESRGEGAEEAGDEELAEGQQPDEVEPEEEEEERQARAPWHFKVVVVGSVVYLGYRAYQGISWLAHHI